MLHEVISLFGARIIFMTSPRLPQAWTSEQSAVRALSALAICHPDEFGAALSSLTGFELNNIDPESIRRELLDTDLTFSARNDKYVFLEAKIDDFASTEQMDRYADRFPNSAGILLVPACDAIDVVEVLTERPTLRAVSWTDLLHKLEPTNPLAGQLLNDILLLAGLPGTKAKTRRLLGQALTTLGPEVKVELTYADSRYPSLDYSVPGTWVFGQVQGTRVATSQPKFSAKIGFFTDEHDEVEGESKINMCTALHRAWEVAERLETENLVRLSRHRSPSKQQQLFGVEHPYQARGYHLSHVGVATKTSYDAAEVALWGCELARAFAAISTEIWGMKP
ncbi:MAG: hypothetical protein ACTIKH_06910 [Glutamicibacter ardleyensis]|uniref:hypothetical protein n=1 Tax=Glutamicibacter ardleyensis TaxID=225894 RepID=UPI003F999F95